MVEDQFIDAQIFYKNMEFACEVFHILYNPVMILVSFKESTIALFEDSPIHLKIKSIAKLKEIILALKLIQKINVEHESIYLFEIKQVNLSLNVIEHWYLKRIYNHSQKKGLSFIPGFTFSHYQKVVAMFSNPKKTYLISVKENAMEKHFPIDLCAQISCFNFIGVRNTNQHASALKIDDEFFISIAAAENYDRIYKLGKFLIPNDQEKMLKSENESLSSVICNFKKVKLLDKLIFEHQTIYVTKTVESTNLQNSKSALYHLHKIWFLQLKNIPKIELIQS